MKTFVEYRGIIVLCVLVLFGLRGSLLVRNAPEVRLLESLEIYPDNTGITIGHEALAQHPGARSADARHLKVVREGEAYRIYNVSRYKKVDVKTSLKDSLLLKRKKLFFLKLPTKVLKRRNTCIRIPLIPL